MADDKPVDGISPVANEIKDAFFQFEAEVIASFPVYGTALVCYGSARTTVQAHYRSRSSSNGAVATDYVSAGDIVICEMSAVDSAKGATIIGIASSPITEGKNTYGHRKLYNVDSFSMLGEEAESDVTYLEKMLPDGEQYTIKVHNEDGAGDAIVGDYDILNADTNCGLHVGKYIAQLRGSPLAFVDASYIDNKVRTVGSSIEFHTPASEMVLDQSFYVKNTALTVQEAFGNFNDSGYIVSKTNDGRDINIKSDAEDAVPLYRLQHMEGEVINGSEDIVVTVLKDDGSPVSIHTAGDPVTVLSKVRKSATGELTAASALAIESVKSPVIQAIQQVAYDSAAEDSAIKSITELRVPYKDSDKEDENLPASTPPDKFADDAVTDAALNKLIDTLLSGDYRQKLLDIMRSKGFKLSMNNYSLQAVIKDNKDSKTIIGGPIQDSQYTLPRSIDLEDKITGVKHRYYDSTSFISQEADGSICLCDGYGSEIRMSRGNIYISPALDLFFRPGRDLSAMVPRHQSYNAQETTTINSAGDMFVRSVGSMKIAGATGKVGNVTIECNGVASTEEGMAGLVIRSDSNTAITAYHNMYIGRNNNTRKGVKSVTEPEAAGSIIVDSGINGNMLLRSGQLTADTVATVIGAIAEDDNALQGSGVVIKNNAVDIVSSTINIPGTLNVLPLKSGAQASMFVTRKGKRSTANFNTAISAGTTAYYPNVRIGGSVVIGDNLIVNGTGKFNGHDIEEKDAKKRSRVATTALVANGIASISSSITTIDKKTKSGARTFKDEDTGTISIVGPVNAGLSSALTDAFNNVYQDAYIYNNRFKFPKTYNVTLKCMPGMRWQDTTRGLATSKEIKVWTEPFVYGEGDDLTACYPGIDVWTKAVLSQKGYIKEDLATSYVVNTAGETNE